MAWLLKVIGVSEAPVLAGAIGAETPAVDLRNLARALSPGTPGGTSAAATGVPQPLAQDPRGRMRLLGVVADRRSGGVALISIDGQWPRPYRVGSQVDASHALTSVATRSATLSPTQPNGPAFTLELPSSAPEPPQRPVAFGGSAANRPPVRAPTVPVPPAQAPTTAPAAANATGTPDFGREQPKN
jgi:general secretion pathway protein C